MKTSIKRLSEFIVDRPVRTEEQLTEVEHGLYRSLKTMGERAVAMRNIDNYLFDVSFKGGNVTLRMVMEGRHSMSVAHQVARRFEGHRELKFANVVKTKKGAKVILRPWNGEEK